LERRAQWKQQGRKVVFTNGCFDLLHAAHIRLLEKARGLGDVLVMGINSDRSVRVLKGDGRPLMPEAERAEVLAALACVDAVTIFDEDTPQKLVTALLPDVIVKGGDWGENIVGKDAVQAAGGEVVSLPYEEGYSTTEILERIVKLK
jgi:rfaE bifunctional protein nucleotidyltransferase chain/domain